MAKSIACIVARTVSTRLPLKILRDLSPNKSMIEFLIERLKTVSLIDSIYICTSSEPVDDILEDIAMRNNIKIYRGSADQVTERLLAVGQIEKADNIIRITGDNPFTSIEYIDAQIAFLNENNLDYVRLVNVPIGSTAEVIKYDALKKCHEQMDPNVSEYLMLFLFEPREFKCGIIEVTKEDTSKYSLTVDTKEDLERTKLILNQLSQFDFKKIQLVDILDLYKNDNIVLPAKSFEAQEMVKMPYDKLISFEEFTTDMNRRKKESLKISLNE